MPRGASHCLSCCCWRPAPAGRWTYTLYGIALGEYYLATRDPWVVKELEEINQWLVNAQHPATAAPERVHMAGGFGHNPHMPSGNGYGSFNVVTAQAMIAWALMERAGLSVDRTRVTAAHEFIAKGTNAPHRFGATG